MINMTKCATPDRGRIADPSIVGALRGSTAVA